MRYNKISRVIAGLKVLKARGGKDCAAEHDIFYAGQGDGVALTDEDVVTLKKHGWFIDGEACTCSHADRNDEHEPTCTGWAVFV